MSRAELEEISEGLITAYANQFSNRVIQSIDIEHFITEFLMLKIEYTSFAESDAGRIVFLADGQTLLLIHQDGKIIPFVFPKDTIVLDKFLLAEREQGRRRFTMAHEASHHIPTMKSLDADKKANKASESVVKENCDQIATESEEIDFSNVKIESLFEEMVGKTLIAITNLPPRKMMGIESCGMLLSAVNNLKDSEDEELHLLMVDNHIPAGAKLY